MIVDQDWDGYVNWLHLDMKGLMPDATHLGQWLQIFADCGFSGIVLEYEDRIPWQTWPDTFRPGYDVETWRRLWEKAEALKLEIVPLIQVQGHLDWLLKHEQYQSMREHEHLNEVCPRHPDVPAKMVNWIDEVIEMHSGLKHIHLGADETWNLASCPRCREVTERSDDGNLKVYLDHVGGMCEHALKRGVRPIIWADMFWREQRFDLTSHLPDQTVLVDWRYRGPGPWQSTKNLAKGGHAVWGGTGVRNVFPQPQALAPLHERIENVQSWHQHRARGDVSGLIHTTWGRSSSMQPLYGPWEGWFPAFVAAGDPARWERHALRELMPEVDRGMKTFDPQQIRDIATFLRQRQVEDTLIHRVLLWWALALDYRQLLLRSQDVNMQFRTLARTSEHVGPDSDTLDYHARRRSQIRRELDAWRAGILQYAREGGIIETDTNEYLDSRAGLLEAELSLDDDVDAKVRGSRVQCNSGEFGMTYPHSTYQMT